MNTPEMFELQLGHLCNDRCVFCISGRITHQGEAHLLPFEPLAGRLRAARAAGHQALTFLGGEPTIQPVFLPLVRLAIELGFERIVIFTNGSKAGRSDLIEQVLATGGNFEWRFSFHGGTEEAHEATTQRKGSFRQLLRAAERAHRHRQRITVNACVVAQNHRSLGAFASLLAPFDVAQVHVDMIHPEDTGNLSLDELRPMMVRYSDVAPHLRAMIAGFPPGFDVNVGNLPQCIAPDLAPFLHHGGPRTETTQASDFGLPVLQPSRDKYRFKERQKLKVDGCRNCVFDDRCSGLFPEYVALYGDTELVPQRQETPSWPLALNPRVAHALRRWAAAAPFGSLRWDELHIEPDGSAARLRLSSQGDGREVVLIEAWVDARGSGYRLDADVPATLAAVLREDLRALFEPLRDDGTHPR